MTGETKHLKRNKKRIQSETPWIEFQLALVEGYCFIAVDGGSGKGRDL